MMEFAVNGRFLGQQVTGVQRFGRETLREITDRCRMDGNSRMEILLPAANDSPSASPHPDLTRPYGCLHGHAWEQLQLPTATAGLPLINFCNTAPIFCRNQVVVLHDVMVAAFPQNFTPAFRLWYLTMIRGYIRTGARLATVSRFSADEISRHFGVPLKKITVIPESGEHFRDVPADPGILEKHGLEPDRYFLAASSAAPNKNFTALIQAAHQLKLKDFKFVIVGGANQRVFASKSGTDFENAVVRTGYVSDGELRTLYQNAACFIFPSFYEGFGLPPLEAMSCGSPVIVARAASMPEVCGDSAVYCDPHNVESLVAAISRMRDNPQLRAELRQKGLEQSLHWRWKDAGDAILDLLDRV